MGFFCPLCDSILTFRQDNELILTCSICLFQSTINRNHTTSFRNKLKTVEKVTDSNLKIQPKAPSKY